MILLDVVRGNFMWKNLQWKAKGLIMKNYSRERRKVWIYDFNFPISYKFFLRAEAAKEFSTRLFPDTKLRGWAWRERLLVQLMLIYLLLFLLRRRTSPRLIGGSFEKCFALHFAARRLFFNQIFQFFSRGKFFSPSFYWLSGLCSFWAPDSVWHLPEFIFERWRLKVVQFFII